MAKPYLKKRGSVSGFDVWVVDGQYVRKNISKDFTNFGQHLHFKFIPQNEFWIDKEYGRRSEERFFIEHLLVENRLMAQGRSYRNAVINAGIIEKRERSKFDKIKTRYSKNRRASLVRRMHKRLFKKAGRLRIWIVDGRIVRDFFDIDFTEGGHDEVYGFIPKNEVWIDDDVRAKERKFILLHELYERNIMKERLKRAKSKKFRSRRRIYLNAHKAASKLEYFYRNYPKGIDEKLDDEIMKSAKLCR